MRNFRRVSCRDASRVRGGRALQPRAQIPALEEARGFLPESAIISNATDGLVEAAGGFQV